MDWIYIDNERMKIDDNGVFVCELTPEEKKRRAEREEEKRRYEEREEERRVRREEREEERRIEEERRAYREEREEERRRYEERRAYRAEREEERRRYEERMKKRGKTVASKKRRKKHRKYREQMPVETREEVLKRDGYACHRCGSKDNLQIHHIKYRSKGGSDDPDNLIVLCEFCHWTVHQNEPVGKIMREHLLKTLEK